MSRISSISSSKKQPSLKAFIQKTLLISLVFFVVIEVLSRFLVDPIYFYYANTYNEQKNKSIATIYNGKPTEHVDYLFIGSSRIPATINPQLFSQLCGGVEINAGRGYMTPGIHYQALKNKLKNHPGFLQNSVVLIEYAGSDIYTSAFEEDLLRVYEPVVESDEAMPFLLLPHLEYDSFLSFLKESSNSVGVKVEMSGLMFSTVRACQIINEKFNNSFSKPLLKKNDASSLVSEGGIRNDNMEFARQKAITVANQEKEKVIMNPPLSRERIEKSMFSKLHEIITSHGGTLMVYEMPLHSVQKDIHRSEKSQRNKVAFEAWLKENQIPVVYNPEFTYADSDFPDTWHLSRDRRDEFTTKLYQQIRKVEASQ